MKYTHIDYLDMIKRLMAGGMSLQHSIDLVVNAYGLDRSDASLFKTILGFKR